MLEVHGIRKSFGSLEVLKGVDLNVQKGDVVDYDIHEGLAMRKQFPVDLYRIANEVSF